MGLSNYPDGMRESDIPGWWDVECPNCDGDDPDCSTCEGAGMVDSRDLEDDGPDPDDFEDDFPSRYYANDWV